MISPSISTSTEEVRLSSKQLEFTESLNSMTDARPYTIIKACIDLDISYFSQTNIEAMTKYVVNRGSKLFQRIVDDDLRFMHTGGWSQHSKAVKSIEDQIKNLVYNFSTATKKNLSLFTPSLIVSKAGCAAQQFHFDYDNVDAGDLTKLDKELNQIKTDKVKNSFFIVVALQNSTTFRGCDPIKMIELPRIRLEAGDVLIGRGDFFHAGDGYSMDNIRMHFYVDFQNWGYPTTKDRSTSNKVIVRKSGTVYFTDVSNITNPDRLRRASNVYNAFTGRVVRKAKAQNWLRNLKK